MDTLLNKSHGIGLANIKSTAEKLDGGTEKISVLEAMGQEIMVKHIEAESELEAKAMMQKEKLEDAYYPKFDMNI